MFDIKGDHERRQTQAAVSFEAVDGSIGVISGYAAVFHEETLVRSDDSQWRERIAPTAFDGVIGRDDVVATFNHDSSKLLGRTTSGTLTLERDAKGLKYRVHLPDSQTGREVMALVQRGDLVGSSFKFSVPKGGYTIVERGKTPSDPPLVQIDAVKLMDVGPVTTPYYSGTSVSARSVPEAVIEYWAEQKRAVDGEQREATRREAEKPAEIRAREAARAVLDRVGTWRPSQ